MTPVPPAATTLEPEVDAERDEPLDLRDIAESSTSFGSYWLRSQLFFGAAPRGNAVL